MAQSLEFEIEENGLGDALGQLAQDAIDSNLSSLTDKIAEKAQHDDIEADEEKVDSILSTINDSGSDAVSDVADKLSNVEINTGSAIGDSIVQSAVDIGVDALDGVSDIISNPLDALSNPSSTLTKVEGLSQDLMNSAEDIVTSQVQSLLASDAAQSAMSAIQAGVDATNEVISTAKTALELIKAAGTVKSNIERLASIVTTIDPQTHTVPSTKGSTKRVTASLKTQVTCAYLDAKQQVVDMGNQMIVTSNDAVIDNVTASIDSTLETVDPLIGEYMEKYCGISIPEVRSTCSEGFQKIAALKRVSKKSKTAVEDRKKKVEKNTEDKEKNKEAAIANKKKSIEKDSERITKLKDDVDAKLNSYKEKAKSLVGSAKENAEQQIKQLEDKAKMYGEQLASFGNGVAADSSAWVASAGQMYSDAALDQLESWKSDYDPSTMKAELLEWLDEQSIILQNAFHILTVKDLIDEIRESIQTIQETSIDNLEDFVTVMQSVTDIFESLNVTENSEGLKIEDFQALIDEIAGLGSTVVDNIISTAKDAALSTADEVKSDMKSIAFDTVESATSLAGEVAASALDVYDQTKETALSTYESGTSAIDSAKSAGLSAYENLADNATGYIQSQADAATTLADTATSIANGNTQTISNILTDATSSASSSDSLLSSVSSVAGSKADEVVDQVSSMAQNTLDGASALTADAISNVTSMTDDALSSATSMASSAVDQAKGATTNILNNASDAATNVTSSVMNSAGDAADAAKSMVDSASQQVIATAQQLADLPKLLSKKVMNSILENFQLESVDNIMGKCVIFDPILKMIQTVLPLLEIVQTLIELVNNYKTNKSSAQSASMKALAEKANDLYENALGLLGKLGLDTTNFYTVRTKPTYDWIKQNLKFETESANTLKLDTAETNKLRIYLAVQKISHNSLKAMLPSVLYIDYEGIETEDKVDGTTNDLDNVIVDADSSTVHYDPEGRHTTSSQVIRYANSTNPPESSDAESSKVTTDIKAESDLTEDEKFNSLMDLITFNSDEIEGQQTVVMEDMELCVPNETIQNPVTDDESSIEADRTIIEFGDIWTKGEAVEYTLNVTPGQHIDNDTILAYIKHGETMTPLRSIFSSGTVLASADETDFWHVFSPATRHIVLEDCEPGTGSDYDPADVSVLAKKMNENGQLCSLLMNAMPYSALPQILTNRTPGLIPNSVNVYEKYIKSYEEIITKYKDIFLNEGGESGIRATGGNPYKMQEQQNKMLEYRKQMLDEVIDSYMNKMPTYRCVGSLSYSDCACLAYGSPAQATDGIFKIGSDNYANYYMSLLANIDLSNDSVWAQKYYELLEKIITTRVQTESYSLNNLISEFNSLVKANAPEIDDPYNMILQQFTDTDVTYDNVCTAVKHMIIYAHATNSEQTALTDMDNTAQNDWYSKQESTILQTGTIQNLSGLAKQLANMFLYIKTESPQLSTGTSSHLSKATLTVVYNNIFRDLFQDVSDPFTVSENKYVSICSDKDITDKRAGFKTWLQSLSLSQYDDATYERQTDLFMTIISTSDEVDEAVMNYVQNNMAYELVKQESAQLKQFWEEAVNAYKTDYDMDALIEEFKDYGESLTQYEQWVSATTVQIRGKNYHLYLFQNADTAEKDSIDDLEIPEPTIPTEIPKPVIDASAMAMDIKEITTSEITMMDYTYWLVYFTNATLLTLLPAYWADGFDIPPAMTPMKLPGIYMPIMKPIYIEPLKVLLVFVLGLRGIWPAPIVVTVNLSSNDINAMFPVQIATEMLKKYHDIAIDYAENTIPNIVKGLINGFIEENAVLKKTVQTYKTYASLIKSIPIPDKALIEKEFKEALHGEIDRRQVVTRTDELAKGVGPDPM